MVVKKEDLLFMRQCFSRLGKQFTRIRRGNWYLTLKLLSIYTVPAERFLPLILPLQLMDPFHLKKLDWATDVLEHWESISLNDPEVPATSKIRVGFFLEISKIFGLLLS
ncbi:unnamed protein product [Brassica rapa]|uniref:Uncharacterized protein n=1 Tax=Brassica campestris TaxID=3711 RepID=A0A8D9G490_BRACM|nr:unnamed protein product [Brassica rapa]